MSADDWQPCPFCTKKAKEKLEKIQEEIEEQYSKVTAEQWDKLKESKKEKIATLESETKVETVRMDGVYDYGFDDESGTFESNIHAECQKCGRIWDAHITVKPKQELGCEK